MKWQAVFFDFDGVILDSVDIKTKAFAKMFRKYGPNVENAVVEYHLTHGGVSRFEKFRYYYKCLLKRPINDQELATLGEEFSRLVLEEVLAAPFIPGALETLQDLFHNGIPAYVASGTPDDEIRHIVAVRELSQFFVEVHGSPRRKPEIIANVIERKGYEPGKCLFLGDAMTDYEAAKTNDMCFIGIVKDLSQSPFPPLSSVSSVVTLEFPDEKSKRNIYEKQKN